MLYADSQFFSPYAMSVFVTRVEKEAQFELQTVDLQAEAHQSPDYQKLSLTSRVPTLTYGDFHLSESSDGLIHRFVGKPADNFNCKYIALVLRYF